MVKACGYCGRTNADEARFCQECGTEFDHPRAKALPAVEDALVDSAPATDLSDLDMGFRMVEAFSRPDWNLIHEYINKQAVPEWDLKKAWTYVAERWLERLAKDLGGTYGIHRSRSFLCLSDLEREDRESLLIFAERTLSIIRNLLGPAAWTGYEGSHVLLIFSEEDDYYSYISYYYPDGLHAKSGGIFIRNGYAHIAIPGDNLRSTEHVLVHELTHNLLCHLNIPLWLNEGIAQRAQELVSRASFPLDEAQVKRHYEFWTTRNIQEFWAGVSFDRTDQGNELSYGLARILFSLLSGKGAPLSDFIAHAEYTDGGQDAALKFLGCDLGETAGEFLGPGKWQPQRLAIARILKPAEQSGPSDS